jgi:Ca2+-binding EF-hand superfamily protein
MAFDKEMGSIHSGENAGFLSTDEADNHLQHTLHSYFKKYDVNGDGLIGRTELKMLLTDFNQNGDEGLYD